jgi:hypothetical protein
MATTKITKKDMFLALLAIPAVAENAEMKDFINHEIELLNRKSTSKKPTATQEANAAFQKLIIDYLQEVGVSKTIKELQAEIPELKDLTNQRMTHLLTPLCVKEDDPTTANNPLSKVYVKKTPHYGYNFSE